MKRQDLLGGKWYFPWDVMWAPLICLGIAETKFPQIQTKIKKRQKNPLTNKVLKLFKSGCVRVSEASHRLLKWMNFQKASKHSPQFSAKNIADFLWACWRLHILAPFYCWTYPEYTFAITPLLLPPWTFQKIHPFWSTLQAWLSLAGNLYPENWNSSSKVLEVLQKCRPQVVPKWKYSIWWFFQHCTFSCTWLYPAVPCCTWLCRGLLWSLTIGHGLNTDCNRLLLLKWLSIYRLQCSKAIRGCSHITSHLCYGVHPNPGTLTM